MDIYQSKYHKYKNKYLQLVNESKYTFTNNLIWRRAEKHFSAGFVDIEPIKSAIINAPSSYGLQPFHVIAITDKTLKNKLKPACYNQNQIDESYALFVFCAIKDVEERIKQYSQQTGSKDKEQYMLSYINKKDKVEWATHQAYIALGFGMAAAMERQIASCPMEGFEPDKVHKILNLDSNLVPCVLLTVGNKNNNYQLEPRFRFKDIFTNIN